MLWARVLREDISGEFQSILWKALSVAWVQPAFRIVLIWLRDVCPLPVLLRE